MQEGEKPRADWRIGTEHEKIVYRGADRHAPPTTRQAASMTC
jgi:glutamate--cysteine ligase